MCQLADHAATGIVLADQRTLPVDLSPMGSIKQLDDQVAIASARRTDPHSQVVRCGTLAGRRKAEQLAEALSFRRCTLDQLVEIAQLWQQCLQWPPQSVAGTEREQVFSTGIQEIDDAFGIDTDNGGRDAAEDIGGLRR